jgi:alkylation response protein AidB-like acyl-CoA dehydrogenase
LSVLHNGCIVSSIALMGQERMLKQLSGTPIDRVNRVREAIEKGADEAQQLRHLPQWLARILIDEGLYRFAIPTELGGENASVRETINILEAIGAIDASVGWNIMIGSEINALAAGGMDPELAKEVYLDDPDVIMCGGGGPGGIVDRAVKVDGGWKIWAQNTFQSGCHNAKWCFQGAPVYEHERPLLDENGRPVMKMLMVPRDQFEIVDTWDVGSLRGSGSHDVRTDGGFVSDKWAACALFKVPAFYPNPAFRIPTSTRLSYNKAAVALGVARGTLDTLEHLAQEKTPFMAGSLLRDRPFAQYRVGECEATYQAAKAFVFEAMDGVTDWLAQQQAPWDQDPPWELIKRARLACTHAAQSMMHVVDVLHNTGGTSAIRMNNPLERKLRDAHGVASHRWVSPQLYEELGKAYLGHDRPAALA